MGPRTRADVGDSARRQHLAAAFVGQASKRASNVRGVGAKKLLRREVANPKSSIKKIFALWIDYPTTTRYWYWESGRIEILMPPTSISKFSA